MHATCTMSASSSKVTTGSMLHARVSLPLEGLSPGRYRVAATVMSAGMPRGRATRTVEVVSDTR